MLEGTIQSSGRSTERGEITGADPGSRRERRRRDLLARLSAMSLTGFGRRLHIDRRTATEATAVARAWLELIDSGRRDLSWSAAGPALQATIGAKDWNAALRSARERLGGCRSRALLGRGTIEGFPGVPPGPYAVVHFESTFEAKPRVVETVTVRREGDGRWRPVSYFIR
jgi:hypothetical protein